MMEKFKRIKKKLVLLSAALCVNLSAAPKSQAMGPNESQKYSDSMKKEDEKSNEGVVRRTVKSLIPIVATVGTVFYAGKYYGNFGGGAIMPEHFLKIIKISGSVGVITSIATEFGSDTVCSGFSKFANYFSSRKDENSDKDLHIAKNKSANKKKDGNSGKIGYNHSGVSDDLVLKAQMAGRKFIKTLSDLLVFGVLEVDKSVKSQIGEIKKKAFYGAEVLHSWTLSAISSARNKKMDRVSREVIEKEMQDKFVEEFRFWFSQVQAGVVAEKLEEATKKIEKILSDLDAKKKESEKQTSPDSKKKKSLEQKSKN